MMHNEVNKEILLLFAGIMWICVGTMLSFLAYHWLIAYGRWDAYIFAGIGIIAAVIIHLFGFLKVVDKNLRRILPMHGKRCAFSFMSWKSYILVAFMISLGITLRHSSIPKQYLSVLYIGIGFALILSSTRYLKVFVNEISQ
ncbi:MAG: hypothetical protein Q8862_05825 [Bacteroidota bacterium]|nr:hypothetical protein [Bacteroidota bacterium]